MRVAQVTARLGETIVDLAHLAPGECYTIGGAPDARLAIAGLTEFPLVTGEPRGFVIRRPVGLGTLAVDGAASHAAELVIGWQRVTFALGLVEIEVALVERTPAPVPRPEIEARTPAFVVGSLIVHLLVWGAAVAFGRLPRAKRPRPVTQAHPLVVHLAPLPPPPPPPETAKPPAKAAARVAGSSTRLSTRIPYTYVIAPPSHPPVARTA